MTKSSSENTPAQTLRFGVMVSGNTLQQWQAESIKLLLKTGVAECKLLITEHNNNKKQSTGQKIKKYFSRTGFYQFYLRTFFRPKAKQKISIQNILPDTTKKIFCRTTKKGFSEYFNQADIKKIRSEELDFILRYGFNIIRGEILQAARYGVWSFHHDDEKKYRGGPPGFWEIMKNDPVTGSILQRLTEKLDAGIIIKKGYFSTVKHSYQGQIDNLYFETARWPAQAVNDIINHAAEYLYSPPSKTNAEIFKTPNNFQITIFFLKLLKNKLLFHYQELFKPEQWNIAVKQKELSHWLPFPDRNRFFADPFAVKVDKKLHILFENYDYRTQKGVIAQTTFTNGKYGKIKTALEEPFHLSYPFLFKYDKRFYCIPETVAGGEIRLYEYLPEEETLTFKKVLIPNFKGADPTLIFYNKKWWLFTTHYKSSNTELYIFYAENPFGPFKPHIKNPVKTDIRNARPGGTPFFINNTLYRPAQNSSETYGQNVVLNQIIKLSETEFEEIAKEDILPEKYSVFKKGLHTFSKIDDLIIIDGKRFKFNLWNFKHQFLKKYGRIRKKQL